MLSLPSMVDFTKVDLKLEDQYLVEEAKKSIVSDFKSLVNRIGMKAAKEWINTELLDLPF